MDCPSLQRIEYSSRNVQHLIEQDDWCLHVGEYTAGRDWSFSAANQFVINIKKHPTNSNQSELEYKDRAIRKASWCLSRVINADWIANNITFVPIPPSKALSDPAYDSRILQVCEGIREHHPAVHVLDLLSQSQSREALHFSSTSASQRSPDLIHPNLQVSPALFDEPRQTIALVDDIITSGASFKACQNKLREHYSDRYIIGVFLARCVQPPDPEDEFFGF